MPSSHSCREQRPSSGRAGARCRLRSSPASPSASRYSAGRAGCSAWSRPASALACKGRWRNVVPFLAACAVTVATTGLYAPFGQFWRWNVTNSPGFVFAGTGIWTALGKGLASIVGFVGFHPVVVVAAGIAGARARHARPEPGTAGRHRPVAVGPVGAGGMGGRSAILRALLASGRSAGHLAGRPGRRPVDRPCPAAGDRRSRRACAGGLGAVVRAGFVP